MCPLFWRKFELGKSIVGYGHGPPEISPSALLNVHTVVPQFECVAVSRNVLVPTAANTATPVVGLKPGAVELEKADDDAL